MLFALWLCIGTHVHVALDHAALYHHAAHILDVGHDHVDSTHDMDAVTICCVHTPDHHGHNDGAPHTHLSDALLAGSTQRSLFSLHAAVVPIRLIDSLPRTAPLTPTLSVALPSEAPAAHNAALRAPPLA
jgi:hypothetical protein